MRPAVLHGTTKKSMLTVDTTLMVLRLINMIINKVMLEINKRFLGLLAKLRKATVSFVMSIRPSVCQSAWNNSTPTGQILIKLDI
jgi:hypothetical protein